MSELVFNITQEPDGGYVAVAVNESIATQGDTWDELCYIVVDATKAYFHDSTPPRASVSFFLSSKCWPSREASARSLRQNARRPSHSPLAVQRDIPDGKPYHSADRTTLRSDACPFPRISR